MDGGTWKGTYSSRQFEYFLPVYIWKKNEDTGISLKVCLAIVPNTWIGDEFRTVVFPPIEDPYMFNGVSKPREEQFFKELNPNRKTWGEFDLTCVARRNGCE